MRTNTVHGWLYCVAIFGALCLCATAIAQEKSDSKQSSTKDASKDGEKIEDKKFDIPYWDRSEAFQIRAAVAVIGEGTLYGVLGARMAISENLPTVQGWEFYFDKALPIDARYLDAIRDGRPLPDMRAKQLRDLKAPEQGMYLAYLNALRRANSATTEMLQRSAGENETVTYTHLAADPKLYRGKVIAVRGTLKILRELDAPTLVLPDGITKIYEGWVVGQNKAAPPFAIVVTQLPAELDRAKTLTGATLNIPVTFQGYFLGNVLFPADKARGTTQKDIVCPWLIGKTLTVNGEPAVKELVRETSNSYEIAGYTVGAIFVLALLIGLLNLYFRRSDAETQKKLSDLRDKHQPFKLEEGEEKKDPEAQG
jgi:hypothetical protein